MTRPFFPSPYAQPAAPAPEPAPAAADAPAADGAVSAVFVPPFVRRAPVVSDAPVHSASAFVEQAARFPTPSVAADPVLPPVRLWVTPVSSPALPSAGPESRGNDRSESFGPTEPAQFAAPYAEESGASESLPWIDAFLADDTENANPAIEGALADDSDSDDDEVAFGEPDQSNEWPLMDEAAEDIAELTGDLQVRDPGVATTGEFPVIADEPVLSAAEEPRGAAPLGPWRDDEPWMDIMPAMPTPAAEQAAVQEAAAATAWAHAFTQDDSVAAAEALESVAAQLRAGTLAVTGFRAGTGEAAALAATLSALLASRS